MMKLAIVFTILTIASECGKSGKSPDNGIHLEKIIFHTTDCFGNCPTHHLELKADKSFKLYTEKVYRKGAIPLSHDYDSTKMGYFTGVVSDSLFHKLTHQLDTIGLDTLTFQRTIYSDGPTITLLVYYNGKRRYFHSDSPTPEVKKLIKTLYDICDLSPTKRTQDKFTIESKEN